MTTPRIHCGCCSLLLLVFGLESCTNPLPELPPLTLADAAIREAYAAAKANPRDAAASGTLGMHFHARQQFRAALACYERAVLLDNHAFRWRYYLGTAQQALGSYAAAEAALAEASRLDPRSVPALLHLAEARLAQSKPESTLQSARRAAALDSNSAMAYYLAGRALADAGRHPEALAEFEHARTLAPAAQPILHASAASRRRLGQRVPDEPPAAEAQVPLPDPLMAAVRALRDDAPEHSNRGRTLESRGRLEEAIREYERAVEIDPAYANAHVNLVGAYGRANRFEQARTHYEAARKLTPASEELNNNWGIICALQGKFTEAEASFRTTLATHPRSADALYNLGLLAAQRQDRRNARSYFERALAADPTHALARRALASE